jgi:cysteinyl-tRNA synthetase
MKLYDTLSRSLERIEPLAPPTVTIYVCGPTVYDEPHLGHARSAFVFDVLRRALRWRGVAVRLVRNVTDVDDKIIERARQEFAHSPQPTAHSQQPTADRDLTATCAEVAERYLKSYRATMGRLGIEPPDVEPLATEHVVPEMTDVIARLLIQGVAYEAQGDVYFAVRKCPGYGALSRRSLDELMSGARVEPHEHKQDPLDFALWKAAKPGEPCWESPWGKGRPGWHIECSAMSTRYLGEAFDIHGGGMDLLFPHHENERAQAQALGQPFARHWVHNGLLSVNGEKMSKSLGNVVTVEQALAACGSEPDVLKMFFLGTHYRSPIDYTPANLQAAGGRWDGLQAVLVRAEDWGRSTPPPEAPPRELAECVEAFERAMDEDLNTPAALAALDRLAGIGSGWLEEWLAGARLQEPAKSGQAPRAVSDAQEARRRELEGGVTLAAQTIRRLGSVLGLAFPPLALTATQQARLQEREAARRRRDFTAADRIRAELRSQGLLIEDTQRGPVVRRQR